MVKNTQPIEKRIHFESGVLEVHSMFRTIQGEGPFTGRPAIFIRLAGCNLCCTFCDTEYSKFRRIMTVSRIVAELTPLQQLEDGLELIVITGGEPFRQNIYPLCAALLRLGFTVQVETNGTLAPTPEFCDLKWSLGGKDDELSVVCSPKTTKLNPLLESLICAYKYVITAGQVDPEDGLPTTALDHTAAPRVARPRAGFTGPVYVQPCDAKNEALNAANLAACIQSVMRHGHTLQIQIHKLIGLE